MKQLSIPSVIAFGLAMSSAACSPPVNSPEMADTEAGSSCGPTALIEDAEDNNNQVIVQDGRAGYIYTYMDPEGTTITPKAGSEGGIFEMTAGGYNSAYAMRMHGKVANSKIVYAGMGLNFTDPKDLYDGTRFKAIAFQAKKGPGSNSSVRVKIPDVNTDPDGGLCGNCYNDFGMNLKLTEEWQQFIIPFSRMKQEPGWGSPRPPGLATDRMFALQFQVKDPGPYDIWVDNMEFRGCEK